MWAGHMQDILKRAKIHVTEGREETDRYNGIQANLRRDNGHEFVETNTSDNPEFKKLSESNVGWIKSKPFLRNP